ncbi:MAG: malate synthase [Cytophagales bacterium]|nr:malate synthase [Cytophagales bacterium]
MSAIFISPKSQEQFPDIYTKEAIKALNALAPLNVEQAALMQLRNQRRQARIKDNSPLGFLPGDVRIPGIGKTVDEIRNGDFECSIIPHDLKCQWIQGTGPAARPNAPTQKSIRNVAYALLSGADGWMFDGEDALGQIDTMSLDNQRNLKLAINRDPLFMESASEVAIEMNAWSENFLGKKIINDWKSQLDYTTVIFRARGLHLSDRHICDVDGNPFSASIVDLTLYIVNNYQTHFKNGSSLVVYLPKIQTAEEAAFWNKLLTKLEEHLQLAVGTIKAYVLIEQLEATFQLLEIRAALGNHFVGFNTGRWDYINSVSDALAGDSNFINPNIEAIGMTYAYMAAYEDRVRRAVNTPDRNGNFSLWQGGMEPNIPVGSETGVQASMKKAMNGAIRERQSGASGKWVAHWKMVHIIRPVWEASGEINQLGRQFGELTHTLEDAKALSELAPAPRTIQGARNLLSVALQYGNAFLRGFQAAALKPADFFTDDDVLYLMEDMATGEIRVSVLWEWLHKGGKLTVGDPTLGFDEGDTFTFQVYEQLLAEEYEKLLQAKNKDVHEDSKTTTLPIARLIVDTCLREKTKAPWYIDLLNLNLNNDDLKEAQKRISTYFDELKSTGNRITKNPDLNPLENQLSN